MSGAPLTVNVTMDDIGHERPASRNVHEEAASLAAALARAGHNGPILIVADNPAITRSGPAWAQAFATRGWLHRVRVSNGSLSTGSDGNDTALAAEAEALALEARTLQASVIVGVGGRSTCAAARAAAAIAGLPAVVPPTLLVDSMPTTRMPAD
jgi:glycerol dehydrogenase-like iron-containing ADH family enzyme